MFKLADDGRHSRKSVPALTSASAAPSQPTVGVIKAKPAAKAALPHLADSGDLWEEF
jgi:hypothetical protein